MTFAVCRKTLRRDINLLELKGLTFPWIEVYTMLALVEEGSTTAFAVNVGKSWYIAWYRPVETFTWVAWYMHGDHMMSYIRNMNA